MRSSFAIAALAATATAQNSTQNLTAALTGNANLSNLTTVITQFPDLVNALGSAQNITILAPSNAAFTKFAASAGAASILSNTSLVQAILSYHVLNGTINSSQITNTPTFAATHLTSPLLANVTGGQRVEAIKNGNVSIISGLLSTSNVTTADVAYNNGIIHVIDTVLTPPPSIAETAVEFNLTSIVGALTKANLVDTISNARDLTVFVPNNAAFEAISSVVSNASVATLQSVLGYHVVNGTVLYSNQAGNGTVQTLSGQNLTTTVTNGSVYVNQAKVVIANVLVANGVVHVIDGVLNPNNTSVAPGNGTAFPGASSASSPPLASGVPTPSRSATLPPVATTTGAAGAGSSSSSSSAGAERAMATGFVGAGMLFAGALMAL